ncbi:MAG: DUF547 domain-containing protein [Hyphomicrobium sp.]
MRRDVLHVLKQPECPPCPKTRPLSPLWGVIALVLSVFSMAPVSRAQGIETFVQAPYTEDSTRIVDHSVWDGLLKTYVVAGPDGLNRVAYAKFKSSGSAALAAYIKSLEDSGPASLGRNETFAYWANLYNAKTVDIVLNAYPVASIKDINLGGGLLAAVTGGPWKAKTLTVKGVSLSLDDIEHGILRPVFKDPRVHYAVNCASVGCPNLSSEAFTGAKLDAQLNAAASAYINHPRGIRVEGGEVTASSIFDWFQKDFGGSEAGVLEHIQTYAGQALKQKLKGITSISDFGYDWSLNDAVAPKP